MCEITNLVHGYPKKHEISIEWISSELWNRFKLKIPTSTLQAYLSTNNKTPFPAFLIAPFCEVCDRDFSVLDLIEAKAGRMAADVSCEDAAINLQNISKLTKEAGEAISVLGASVASKQSLDEKKQSCLKELLDLQKITTSLLMQLYK